MNWKKIYDTEITANDTSSLCRENLDDGIYAGMGIQCSNRCDECCDICANEFGHADKCVICDHPIPGEVNFNGGRSPYECTACGAVMLTCWWPKAGVERFAITGFLKKIDNEIEDII